MTTCWSEREPSPSSSRRTCRRTEELSDDDMSSDGETSATCEPSFMLCSHLRSIAIAIGWMIISVGE